MVKSGKVTKKTGAKTKRTSGKKAAGRTRGTAKRKTKAKKVALPSLGRKDGCLAMLQIAERVGKSREDVREACAIRGETGTKAVASRIKTLQRAADAMGGVAHPVRSAILVKLLDGPATYRALQKSTRLKPGPLYHHINQLRLGGLILPRQRDLYELTRGGRNLILASLVLAPLVKDLRPRPMDAGA